MASRLNNRVFWTVREFFRRHWRGAVRWREKVVFREEVSHLILAGAVGILGGLVNFFFFQAIEVTKLFFLRHPGDPVEIAQMMMPWQRVLIPALGGMAAGLVLHWGLRLVGWQGSTNLLEVVVAGAGKLPLRTGAVKALSSLISIGTGASIGREGAITQLTATFASKIGQLAQWPPYRLRLLVGCGAASGIAAAYNAPIAGAVFAALIVLGNFSMNLFAPLVFASVVATMVSRSLFGIAPWYQVPPYEFTRLGQLPWFILLGVVAGLVGAVFLKMLHYAEERFQQIRAPIYVKLSLAGLLVGLIAIEYPFVWGNGYAATHRILHDQFADMQFPLLFLLGLFLAKLLATVVTVGSGTVGGVFTPTLFLGASLGALFGDTLHHFHLGENLPMSTFALVGMGGTLAATTRSPLLAMIMIFEISLDYSLMPALMLGCVLAILTAARLHRDSIYTGPLRLRGVEFDTETVRAGTAVERTVGDLMHEPVTPVREETTLREVADRFLVSPNNYLPVVNGQKRLIGVLALQDLKEHLGEDHELLPVIAFDIMRPPPPALTPGQRLMEVIPVVLASELRNIPVVNNYAENRLVGSLARGEVLQLLSEAIAAGSKPAG